ncbi:MAG: DUF3341 domain-containing protein [candidate division Zixibacteria bacterium]|nr:DUF3341 domain-containing protein [candidate division Zixibacteria bacterium]
MAKLKLPAVFGLFDDPDTLKKAAELARLKGFENLDAFTPYPVHGLEKAMGLKMSWIPYVTLICGLGGATLGYLFMYWISAVDWPLNVGGKPFHSWPAFIPITFECGILLGGVSTFLALLFACGLPGKKVILDPELTNNRFALVIPEKQDKVRDDIQQFLKGAGAFEVRKISG